MHGAHRQLRQRTPKAHPFPLPSASRYREGVVRRVGLVAAEWVVVVALFALLWVAVLSRPWPESLKPSWLQEPQGNNMEQIDGGPCAAHQSSC